MDRLGFADLNDDEALAISMYRNWLRPTVPREVTERYMTVALSHDILHNVLNIIFATFRKMTPDAVGVCSNGYLLSHQEEHLIDALSQNIHVLSPASSDCQRTLLPIIRPTAQIHRSGQDELRQKVNVACWQIASYF